MEYRPDDHEKICEVLKVLANPQRLCIAHGLCENECNVSKIIAKLGIPQSTASSHIARLKSAGIIRGKRNGNEICYTVTAQPIKELIYAVIKAGNTARTM
jgi:DNA-binding transcriptional ArsR family regulator